MHVHRLYNFKAKYPSKKALYTKRVSLAVGGKSSYLHFIQIIHAFIDFLKSWKSDRLSTKYRINLTLIHMVNSAKPSVFLKRSQKGLSSTALEVTPAFNATIRKFLSKFYY